MAYFDVTTFDGVTIVTSVRVQVAMNETGLVVARIGQLENGAIYDADSTTDADTQLGLVTVRYKILPASNGASNLNGQVRPLENLKGKHGTLTGVERATPEVTYTCTARCISVITEDYVVGGLPMNANNRQRAFVTLTWQKLTQWA